MWIDVIETLLLLAVVALLGYAGWYVRFNLLPYLEDLRRNLLTKSDLLAITEEAERLPEPARAEPVPPAVLPAAGPKLAGVGFEREFEILSELWDALLRLQRSTLELDLSDKPGDKKGYPPARELKLHKFADNFNLFSELVYTKRPFYPQPIYECLMHIMALADRESSHYSGGQLAATEQQQIVAYWENVGKNKDEIIAQIDRIAELIRQRLAI